MGSSGSTPSHHSDQKYSYDQVNKDRMMIYEHTVDAHHNQQNFNGNELIRMTQLLLWNVLV